MESDVLGTRKGSRKAQNSNPNAPLATIPFNPTSLITGAGGFWRADMGVTLSGSNVTQWNDQSSFGNNLTAGSNFPTFSSTGFNSAKPGVIIADAGTHAIAGTFPFSSAAAASLFCLIQWESTAGSNQRLYTFIGAGAAGDFDAPTSFTPLAHSNTDFGVFANSTFYDGINPTSSGSLYLFTVVFDGVNITQYSVTTQVSQNAYTNIPGTASNPTFTCGQGATGGNSAGQNIAFVGLTQHKIVGADLTNLKTWSNTNWGTSF